MANPRLLLVLADSTLASIIVDSFTGVFDVTHVTTLTAGPRPAAHEPLRGGGLVARRARSCWRGLPGAGPSRCIPGVRMLSAHAHLVPHMVTLARMRPNPVRDWRVRAPVSATLVDAMVASVDDPVFDGPHIN
jgi:hypothetical protein